MRFTFVFVGLSALVVVANGQQQQGNEPVVDATAQPNDIVSDQEALFPASLLNNAQLQSIEAQLQQPINPLPAIPQEAQKVKDKDTDDQDQSEDDDDDGDEDGDDEDDDEGGEEAEDWVNAAEESQKDLIQKQNHVLTTSWSVSGSSSYPIVIDTDFVFNPITLAPESSRTSATTIATATPAVRNKKKAKPASSAVSSNTLTSWPMAVPFAMLSASYLLNLYL
ncbi:hypothetical protein MAM1_0236d08516 [Mucor ambiguus]|uniref:Uncharacterized protein n=1 Tax=Mucor ambiguus TaxID=91626 RepID=A0A0C9LWR7_9FUNG|nr:hypothetical protein MAM1_0236d08516 [Mucor ambiguus]